MMFFEDLRNENKSKHWTRTLDQESSGILENDRHENSTPWNFVPLQIPSIFPHTQWRQWTLSPLPSRALPSPHPTWPPSYLELLQLLLDHLHLRAHHSLGVQVLFCFSQQALQLIHQSVELLDSAGGFLDLVQSGLASLAQLEHGERKQRLCLFTMEFLKEIQGQNIYNL